MSEPSVETPSQVFERLLSEIAALKAQAERLADEVAFTALWVLAEIESND